MPFDSGRVTFTRFHVNGDAPSHVDDAFLSILSESRFREHELGEPDEVEAGFTTGVHLFDTQFTYDKNGFGTPGNGMALFALRMDTHKVPADVKKAYRVMNEQAAASGNPTGFPSKSEKREARETANQQIRDELASGKYRKSKVVPVLWDFASQTLYCGAAGTTVIEHLSRLMRHAFAVELDNLSAGVLAGNLIKAQGKSRDYEDLQPSAFTAPPDAPRPVGDDDAPSFGDGSLPVLPWIAKSVDLKDYLGNEFLMWLWWHGEKNAETPTLKTTAGDIFVAIDKALDMDCAWDLTGKQTLRGDGPTRLPEAGDALTTGKWPRKTGLILADAEHQWELTLQGDQFVVSGAALPEIEDVETARELTERRLELVVALSDTLNALFTAFLDRRASGPWKSDRDAIKAWIKDRQKKSAATPALMPSAAAAPAPV
ncbi:hypothetical protein [Algisphaera agarilytica]|uniref:Recombination-associated protein RdgC n=1 Tax=Algisphaera agarilytica TaxID=1385975 RepID=A0A7X0H8U6_9BACT|nr:hypothetical protein [Algisphaera agarilytica]MBB6430221.1 hypothetical protein [Algisphaera agarilytica]